MVRHRLSWWLRRLRGGLEILDPDDSQLSSLSRFVEGVRLLPRRLFFIRITGGEGLVSGETDEVGCSEDSGDEAGGVTRVPGAGRSGRTKGNGNSAGNEEKFSFWSAEP
jgi:hypothetical protein